MNIRKIILLILIIGVWLLPSAYAASKGAEPVAHWRFDEGGGATAYDETANNNDGALNAGAGGTNTAVGQMWTRQGKIGGALECDGTDDYVNSGLDISWNNTNSVTVSFWIRPNNVTDGNAGILGKIYPDWEWAFYQSGAAVNLVYWNNGGGHTNGMDNGWGNVLQAGQWTHLIYTWDGTTSRFYANGVLKTTHIATDPTINQNRANNMMIGGHIYVWADKYFNGLIDDLKVYSYTRTAEQILVDYNAGSAAYLGAGTDPNEGNPPVGYWTLDENTGTTAYDRSGSGNNGTINGNPVWSAGKYGSSLNFDGNDSVSNSTFLDTMPSALTIEAWFKLSSNVTSNCEILRKVNVGGNRLYLYLRSTTDGIPYGITFDTEAAGGGYSALSAVSKWHLNEWIHVAVSWDTTNGKKIYINGVLEASDATKTTLMSNGTLEDFYIGTGGFTGFIDEIKIYGYSRTPAQIAYDYNRGKPVAHYKFDEGGGAISHNEYSSADSGSAPVAWYRMDNNWNDASGNGLNGTAQNGATFTSSSKIGPYCGSFDGIDDWMVVTDTTNSPLDCPNAVTFEAWFYTTALADKELATKTYSWAQDIWLKTDGKMYWYIRWNDTSYNTYVSNSTFSINTWHHLTLVADTSTDMYYIYKDGVLDKSGSIPSDKTIGVSNNSLYIGTYEGSTTYAWPGLIDDVRIYNYARIPEQIYNDYKTTHGTLVGDTKFVDGKIGKALQFNGSSDYVSGIHNISGDSQLTVEAWIKTSYSAARQEIVSGGSSSNGDGFLVYLDTNGKLNFDYPVQKGPTGSITISDGNWHHIVAVKDGSNRLLYVDGKADGSSGLGSMNISTNILYIGRATYNNSNYTNGLIDDVRIYNYARTADQIMQDYNAGAATRLGPQSAGVADPWAGALPVAHWRLDENTGVLAYDASGNGNNGTLTNGPTWTQGKVGSALSFDGSDDYVAIPYNPIFDFGTNLWTIGGWINTKSPTIDQSLIEWGSYLANGFLFRLNEPNGVPPKFMIYIGGASYTWNYTFTVNTWYHLMITRNSSTTVEAFVNGISQGTLTIPSGTTITAGGGAAWIGKMTSGGGATTWSGLLDDVRIYNYARTQAQIAWDYNRGAPVGHWRFDEATSGAVSTSQGAIRDESTNNNGTASATTFSYTTGKFGGALSFDGNDVVELPLTSTLQIVNNSFTAEAWVKVSAYDADDETIFGTDEAAVNTGLHLVIRGQKPYMGFYANDTGGNTTLSTGVWYHIAWVYTQSNGEQRIYVNGVSDAATTGHAAFQGTGIVRIGRWASSYYFHGLIDDVRIYNYSRTAEQILQDYNAGAAARLGD